MWRTPRFLSLAARLRRAVAAPLPLLGLVAAIGPLALTSGSAPVSNQAEVAYRALPALPDGSGDHGADGVARTAIALAAELHAVPLDALGAECPVDDLVVSWDDPGDRYSIGAHVTPIGPAPDATTDAVNGIVACRGSDYAYMGFEARWVADRWDVIDVPFVGEEEDEHVLVPQPAPAIPQGPKPVPVLAAPGTVTGPIEGYAAYEPQRTCDPTAKVGTRSLAGALLRDYAGSRNLGIVRGCAVGGRSEHKEGRAFDWGVNITNPNEKAAAQAFIGALMATDAAGNRHALARRMGVMYLIWDRQIWSAYRASEGWRPYSGSSPHRDHVHLSLSWAGALGRTSFWSGTVPPDLPTASPVTANVASRRPSGDGDTIAASSDGGSRRRRWTPPAEGEQRPSVHLSRDQLRDGVRALWHDGQPPSAAEIQAWLVGQGVPAEWAAQYAAWAAERAARHASRDRSGSDGAEEAAAPDEHEHDDDDDDDDRDWRAEREAREAAAREARQAAEEEWERRREERREAEREARQAAEQEREEAWRAERERRRLAREEWERRQREARQTTTTVAPPPTTAAPTPTPTTAAPAPVADATSTPAPVVETTAPAPAPTEDHGDRHRGRGGRRGGRRGG